MKKLRKEKEKINIIRCTNPTPDSTYDYKPFYLVIEYYYVLERRCEAK